MKRSKLKLAASALKLVLPAALLVGVVLTLPIESHAQLPPPPVGGPLPGLSPQDMQKFNAGQQRS